MNRKAIQTAVIISVFILSGSICLGQENQIINGEFDTGIEPWKKSDGGGFTIDVVQDAGLSGPNALKIGVLDAAAQESIMVSQGIFVLERGATYHIGFTAKANADRQMGVLLELDGSWSYAWHEWIDLTPLPQTFNFEYIHTSGTTQNVVFYFILKHPLFPLLNENENIDVYIDGVYVVQEPPGDPNLAHYPWPADGAVHEDLWAVLSWSTGRHAVSHDVYFGESHDDVYNGTENTFGGNQDTCFWIIGIGFDFPRPLVPGTTYYWRIDEVNDLHPDSPWRGEVWSFWIPPLTAYDPYPSDGTESIDPNVTLSWKASSYANTYNVYFGENVTDVEDSTGDTFKGSFSETSYTPNCLDFDTTYYWRVDVFYSWGTYEQGEVWSFSTKPAGPNIAHDPQPPDGAIHADTWATLTWTPGYYAASHNIYFGDNFDDVNKGTNDTFRGNQSLTFYIVGFPIYIDPTGLIPGTTYYWRVDEVNNLHPDSPWKGDVWSLTIAPKTAYDPVPTNGAEFVNTNVLLSWKAGIYAKSHTIYFGDNFDDVNRATGGVPQQSTTYTPGLLDSDMTYYWRIDEYDGYTTQKGAVWSFSTIPGLNIAYDPYPADGAELSDPNIILSWEAGIGAKLHVLYFGENLAEVEAGTGGTFKGYLSETSYFPGPLEFDKTYYWWIDEYDGYTTHKGEIWSFSTKPAEPNIAHDPIPADGAMYMDTWITCSWSPGRYAATHDVYFGENYDEVYNGTGDTYWGNYRWTYFVYGFLDYAGSPGLIPGTTYYWRIDEVNDLHPDSPWRGEVWSFWIPPLGACDPIPADGAKSIDPNITLSWSSYHNATSYTVYFGDNFEDVNNATKGTPQQSTTYTPGRLELNKTYSWRVDALYGWQGFQKGEVWSFTTHSITAGDPYPADGTIFGSQNVIISWKSGTGAVLHDVYFGTDFDDVNNVNLFDSSGIYRGRSAETSYAPEELELHRIYYWRIDEVEADGVTIHKGNVWSFTVAEAEAVIYQVSASEDDGYAFNPIAQNLQTDYLKVGYSGFAQPPYYMSGMIFRNVNIPPGSVILSALLKVRSYNSNQTGTVYAHIEAEATDDAAGFIGFRRIDTLPKTNASVDWIINESWSANMWYESPDIAGMVQEVIDRAGWTAGNSLAILLSTSSEGGYRNFYSYDHCVDHAPILEVQY